MLQYGNTERMILVRFSYDFFRSLALVARLIKTFLGIVLLSGALVVGVPYNFARNYVLARMASPSKLLSDHDFRHATRVRGVESPTQVSLICSPLNPFITIVLIQIARPHSILRCF